MAAISQPRSAEGAAAYAAFIAANTRIAAAPLVPEIRLLLATEVTPLWTATEVFLEETGTPPPYWAFAWPGGQALARHILDRPALVRGKAVLDFAAGCGIAAIAAALAGAKSVAAADIDPVACLALAANALLNDVLIESIGEDLTSGVVNRWDVILAGDICYERPMAERVVPWLRRFAGSAMVLLADPGRAYLPQAGLEEIATYAVPTSLELEDREIRHTRVLRLLP
ncbi:MAG: methyltransferase [Rhodospirillaceae bacterium]|nr:methyltransferase [Rhodospirillaceae bacterium]